MVGDRRNAGHDLELEVDGLVGSRGSHDRHEGVCVRDEVLQNNGELHVVLLRVAGGARRDDEGGEVDGEEAEVADVVGFGVGPPDVHLGHGHQLGDRRQLRHVRRPDRVHGRAGSPQVGSLTSNPNNFLTIMETNVSSKMGGKHYLVLMIHTLANLGSSIDPTHQSETETNYVDGRKERKRMPSFPMRGN